MKRVEGWGERVVENLKTTNLPSKLSTLTAAKAGYNVRLVHSQEAITSYTQGSMNMQRKANCSSILISCSADIKHALCISNVCVHMQK